MIDQHNRQLDLFSPTSMQFKSHVLRITWNLCFARVKDPVPLCYYLKGIITLLWLSLLFKKRQKYFESHELGAQCWHLQHISPQRWTGVIYATVLYSRPKWKEKQKREGSNPANEEKHPLSFWAPSASPVSRPDHCGGRPEQCLPFGVGRRTPPKTKFCPASQILSVWKRLWIKLGKARTVRSSTVKTANRDQTS